MRDKERWGWVYKIVLKAIADEYNAREATDYIVNVVYGDSHEPTSSYDNWEELWEVPSW